MTNAPPVAGEADPVALGESLRALRAALLAHRNLPESLRQANPRLLDDLWWRLRGIPGRLAEALVAHGGSPVGPSNLGELVDAFRDRVSDWRSSVSSTYRADEEGLRTALEGGPAPETTEEELGRIFERPGEPAPMRPGLLQIIDEFADLVSSLVPVEPGSAKPDTSAGTETGADDSDEALAIELSDRERAAFNRLRQEEGRPVGQAALAAVLDRKVRNGTRQPDDDEARSVARSAVKALREKLDRGATVDGARWTVEDDHAGLVRFILRRLA